MLKRKNFLLGIILFFMFQMLLIGACGDSKEGRKSLKPSGLRFNIVSGSENKEIEPFIQEYAKKEGVSIHMDYMGSVDMMLALSEQGGRMPYDAVWPANSIWIVLGDQKKVIKYAESILRSPVILGVRKSIAERLGWTDNPIQVADFLQAARDGKIRFAMTSATQSNSGASALLGFLHAFAGSPEILQTEHLENPVIQEKIRALLKTVDRSSGSSGWLKFALVEHPERFQAMINYESMIIEANQELIRKNQEPLYAVYPRDAIMISDSPLGYVDKGDEKKEAFFRKLQKWLLSEAVQKRILSLGRRTGLVGINPDMADKAVFNPNWGIDLKKIISPVPTPSEDVIRKALEIYQVSLRKPSCTAYVLDVSGSMEGKGIQDLKNAMATLLDQDQAKRYMLQPSPQDIHIIIPFNSNALEGIQAMGNTPETLNKLLSLQEVRS